MKLEEKKGISQPWKSSVVQAPFRLLFSRGVVHVTRGCGVSAVCLHTFFNAWEGLGSTVLLSMAPFEKGGDGPGQADRIRRRERHQKLYKCFRFLWPPFTYQSSQKKSGSKPYKSLSFIILDLNLNGCHVFSLGAPPFKITSSNILAPATKSQGGLSSARRAEA